MGILNERYLINIKLNHLYITSDVIDKTQNKFKCTNSLPPTHTHQ